MPSRAEEPGSVRTARIAWPVTSTHLHLAAATDRIDVDKASLVGSIGAIIGSGIFGLPSPAAGLLGTRSPFAVLLAGVAVTPVIACYAEVASYFTQAGGPYLYLREAYGDFIAFLYGWMVFTVYNTGGIAALAVGFGAYFAAAVPGLRNAAPLIAVGSYTLSWAQLLGVICIVALTAVNVYGLRRGAIVQDISSWMKFAAIGIFLFLGILVGKFNWSHFASYVSISAAIFE